MNKSEIKKLQTPLIMLFHHYFLVLCGTIMHNNNGNNVVLKMNSFDVFWNDFLLIALSGIKKMHT